MVKRKFRATLKDRRRVEGVTLLDYRTGLFRRHRSCVVTYWAVQALMEAEQDPWDFLRRQLYWEWLHNDLNKPTVSVNVQWTRTGKPIQIITDGITRVDFITSARARLEY